MLINLIKLFTIIILIRGTTASDACKDFHKYVCKDDTEEMMQDLENKFEKKLLSYLDTKTKFDEVFKHTVATLMEKQTFYDKMLIYYESCMNKDDSLVEYLEAIKDVMIEINFDYWSVVGQIHSYGVNNVLIRHDISRDNDKTLIITLQPVPIEETNNWPREKELKDILQRLGFNHNVLEGYIKSLQQIEKEWKQLSQSYATKCKLKKIKNIQLKDLTVEYPNLKIQNYLKHLMGNELQRLSLVRIKSPEFFQYLNDKQWTAMELDNYRLYLSVKFVLGVKTDCCIKDLWKNFHLGVNFLYFIRYYRWEAEEYSKTIYDMWNKIKIVMAIQFHENHLKLSPAQIEYLKYKLIQVKLNIGNLVDVEAIQDYYENLPLLNKANYYENHLYVLKHKFQQCLIYDQKKFNFATFFPISPFYEVQPNMIVLPYGSLQLPLLHYRQTTIHKLSLFGFVLAHELTHAFDNKVLASNPSATAKSITTNQNFIDSLQCLKDQHNTNFMNERVADIFALRVVYHTYKLFYAENSSNWQREFFINMGKFFCGTNTTFYEGHDTDPIRLQQLVSNFEPFAEAFECKVGDAMNPSKKCRLY